MYSLTTYFMSMFITTSCERYSNCYWEVISLHLKIKNEKDWVWQGLKLIIRDQWVSKKCDWDYKFRKAFGGNESQSSHVGGVFVV